MWVGCKGLWGDCRSVGLTDREANGPETGLSCWIHMYNNAMRFKPNHTPTAAPARLTATEMITELVPYAKLIGARAACFFGESCVFVFVWRFGSEPFILTTTPPTQTTGQHQQPPQRPHGTTATPTPGAHRPDNDDEEDEARAASLASALGFLRLFNRRCSGPPERAVVAAGVGGVGGEGDDGGSGGGPTDLDVDDIVEED